MIKINKKYKVGGMTCSACANRVERGVKKMEGINNANVNLTTEILTVDFDEPLTEIHIRERLKEKSLL